MPAAGDRYERNGMIVRFVRVEPDVLEMDVSYPGDAGMPPAHHHPSQAEHFEVLEGTMHTVIDGNEQTYSAGDEFDVPVAAVHQMSPVGPARMRWEVRPALRTPEFFERVYTGRIDENFLQDFSDVIRFD